MGSEIIVIIITAKSRLVCPDDTHNDQLTLTLMLD